MDKKAMVSEQTKKALKASFLELYAENGITGITVGAITKKAGYNRCTFYNYYNDVYDLLAEIEDSILAEISGRISADKIQVTDLNEAFSNLLPLFEDYGNTIYVLISKSGNSDFRNRFKKMAFGIYRKAFADKFDAEQIEYLISYASSCGLGLIEHWYETGKKYSTEEFLKLMQELVAKGLMGQIVGV